LATLALQFAGHPAAALFLAAPLDGDCSPNWLFLSLLTETSTELYIKIQEITNLFSSERKKEILT
jgi:hypothetical protein